MYLYSDWVRLYSELNKRIWKEKSSRLDTCNLTLYSYNALCEKKRHIYYLVKSIPRPWNMWYTWYMHADATQSSHEQFMFEVGTSNNYQLKRYCLKKIAKIYIQTDSYIDGIKIMLYIYLYLPLDLDVPCHPPHTACLQSLCRVWRYIYLEDKHSFFCPLTKVLLNPGVL